MIDAIYGFLYDPEIPNIIFWSVATIIGLTVGGAIFVGYLYAQEKFLTMSLSPGMRREIYRSANKRLAP
jgi:hypothetical protein